MNLDFLKQTLSDKGEPSSGRVFNAWAIFWLILVLAFGYIWVVLKSTEIVIAYAGIISALIAGILGIQTWKKSIEVNDPNKKEGK